MRYPTPFIFLLALFILGCTTTPPTEEYTLDAENTSTEDFTEDNEENIAIPEEPEESAHDRRLKARGFGIFDLTSLTSENCDSTIFNLKTDLVEQRARVDDLEEDLVDEEDDLDDAEQAYQQALQTGNQDLIDETKEDREDRFDDVEELKDKIDDDEDILNKLKVIVAEAELECKAIKAQSTSY